MLCDREWCGDQCSSLSGRTFKKKADVRALTEEGGSMGSGLEGSSGVCYLTVGKLRSQSVCSEAVLTRRPAIRTTEPATPSTILDAANA